MKLLYLYINICSIIVPFLVTFHPRLKFYKKWKALVLSIVLSGSCFILWDVYFTKIGVWGFNSNYYLGYKIGNLPIEEWLFFISIPYACVFTHYALIELFPNLSVNKLAGRLITMMLFFSSLSILFFNYNKLYTCVNFSVFFIVLLLVYSFNKKLLYQFYKTFLLMLIPFFIVNGILTGTGIIDEVVWYNDLENLGIKMITIPIEDAFYAFSLLLLNVFLVEFFQKKVFCRKLYLR